MSFRGRRVTIMGLGHFGGGVAAARWLARQGASVTVTDLADETDLADSLAELANDPIARFRLGGHLEEDFRGAEMVVVNPAVRPGNPFVQIAREAGARLTSEIELLMEAAPGRIIGVTGSNGKSTTAAMTAAILRAAGRRTWLGGNIGGSLLPRLKQIRPHDWIVLELSSFQLWHLAPSAAMPQIAVVTGCSPNHLDWHDGYQSYVAAKQRILVGQNRDDLAVLNTHDAEVDSWAPLVRGRRLPLPSLSEIPPLLVPGEHNRSNAACAAAAGTAAGCDTLTIRRALKAFRGLPQRLEWFAAVNGRRFYNDSTSTTPHSTIAALESLQEPVWLLAGGRNKGLDLGDLAAAVVRRAQGAAFFGACADTLRSWVAAVGPQFPATATETMDEALSWCWQRSRPGDAVLLAPACASTDQFRNFRARGESFVELVRGLAEQHNR